MVSTNQVKFTAVKGLPSSSIIASDKKDNAVFYGASGSALYVSTDGGVTFSACGSLGTSTTPFEIAANPDATGDVWVSSEKGLFRVHSLHCASAVVPGITQAWGISLGAPRSAGGYRAVFVAADMQGTVGYYRSDDEGMSWIQINDAKHGFASAAANVISGDPRVYGR